jgi:hypothetical protein
VERARERGGGSRLPKAVLLESVVSFTFETPRGDKLIITSVSYAVPGIASAHAEPVRQVSLLQNALPSTKEKEDIVVHVSMRGLIGVE